MTTVTLYPTDDAHVDSNNADTNYGTDTLMDVGDSTQYAFVQFDSSSIPVDAVISAATIYYYIQSNTGSTPLEFRSTDASVDESTITWDNKPTASESATSGSISGTGNKNAPVRFLVIDALAKDSSFIGIRIINYLDTNSVEIRSKEYDTILRLSITYTAPSHYYVKASGGNDANDGLSWGNAWATIDKAATTVADNSVVHIGFGTYSSEPANNDIAPINAGAIGIKYLPETATTGGGTGSVIVEVN